MQHSKTTDKPQDLVLYHGTLGIEGGKISLRSNQGVGWNNLTLGDAFYTTPNLEASKLFSHLVLQKNILMGGDREENLGYAKIYKIKLKSSIKILDAESPLDANAVRGALLYAGVSERYLKFRHDDQLTDFNKSADLLCYGLNWEGNRNEYLTKSLGYDAIMIRERAWDNWDYFPTEVGIDWTGSSSPGAWPPLTVAIYDDQMVSGFELFRDGIIYGSENEILENYHGR